jgi:hypothetical protein
MREVHENLKAVLNDFVALVPLQVCDEANAARIVFVGRIVKALRGR